MKHYWLYEYPVGTVGITETDGKITHVFFQNKDGNHLPKDWKKRETPLLKKTAKQLTEYFAGKRKSFDLPLEFEGTDFQKKVWAALMTIPYGETRTYGEIANQTGSPKAYRAAGMANHNNPIAIICPCHRVIGSDGSLTGYGGGLSNKKYLLDMEGKK